MLAPTSATDVLYEFTTFVSDLADRLLPSADFGGPAIEPATLPSGVPIYVTDVANAITSEPSLHFLVRFWEGFVPVSLFIIFAGLAGSIYCFVRITQIRKLEKMRFEAAARTVEAKDVPKTQLRWHRIMDQIGSDNEHNWRMAILEADIMLNELLDLQGYKGETIADKMKQVERANFNTIDMAWEAHKIRNRVAHEGAEHVLTHREARRVIDMYARVFREFGFI